MTNFHYLNYLWILIAVVTLITLLITKIRAPYGRHANEKWGKMIDNRWGWFWMELPAFLICPGLAILGTNGKSPLTWLLIFLWFVHYFNRTIIFPFRLKTTGKKMPLTIVFSALFFNGVNGFLNGYYLGFLAPENESLLSFSVILGVAVFITGMTINRMADHKLISLRSEQKGYQIPRKWLFEYISCPNHFGEIVEWIGFAIIACNVSALTFAIWTACNLIPRAINHHDWYKETFPDYPKDRKAVIPGIF
jgi:steroid 5-alpha reductase family enzyme